jgi:hypothetical protein
MAPPSKDTVTRVFFTEGINIGPGLMVTSQDATNDKVEMELTSAGVRIMGRTFHCIVPYARVKSINVA